MRLTARRSLLLLVFSLLTSAVTADAECAWVLGQEMRILSHSNQSFLKEYEVYRASASPQECQRALEQTLQARTANLQPGPKGEMNVEGPSVIIRSQDGFTSYGYICLPDTVDPRGPKGK